jgi:O-antigen/teichoic acid export membrane protein
MKSDSRAGKLLRSGIIYSAINFLTGLGNLAFQSVMGHHLDDGQYSTGNSIINAFMPLLALPSQMAILAVTHYIAHFNAIGDITRLYGLLAGCRKFLFQLTIFGSVLAIIAIEPLSRLFHYSERVMLITLVCTLLGLWTSLLTALCQGLAWFKRLALIGFIGMLLRVIFGYVALIKWPSQEMSVIASTFTVFAYLILLFWRKDLSLKGKGEPASPWNHEFILYLVVSAAFVIGNYCFSLSDLLVMQLHFSQMPDGKPSPSGAAYAAAERLAISLPITVAPLLTVLFTNRSVEHTANALRQQLKLLGLYAFGLICGAIALYLMRHICLRLIGRDTPEAADMIKHLSITMFFVGLLQAVGTWALASRWSRISLLYGALGICYTIIIFAFGKTASALLNTMPIVAGIAFLILFTVWFAAMRRHKPVA